MADHAALVPSFRDFSYLRNSTDERTEKIPAPTVREVTHALANSPAGRIGQAVSTRGWPWLERMGFTESVIPGIQFHSLGGMVPFQADGVWGPYEFYYRERHGGAELRLAPIATFPGPWNALYSSKIDAPEFAGTTGWLLRFLKCWEELAVAPFLYEFQARNVGVQRDDESDELKVALLEGFTEVAGWGHTPQEARSYATAYTEFYDERFGWTRAIQEERFDLMEIAELPLNSDDRVFSEDEPRFEVNWNALAVPEEHSKFVMEYKPVKVESGASAGVTEELMGALTGSSLASEATADR